MRVQIAQRASTGEQQQKQVKWNILHYHQGSPFVWSLLLYLLSEALHNYRMCSPETVCTHVNVHTHAPAHARTHTQQKNHRRNKIPKKGRRNKIWDVFECVLLQHYSVSRPSSVAGNRQTGATIRVWCDTPVRPLSRTTPANMQAHLSRALKPSLILWRPKHSNFFQQTSSQLALDCQWGCPNS